MLQVRQGQLNQLVVSSGLHDLLENIRITIENRPFPYTFPARFE